MDEPGSTSLHARIMHKGKLSNVTQSSRRMPDNRALACGCHQLPAAVQLAAVREAYTDARAQAEAGQAQLHELARAHADLGKRTSLSLQQVTHRLQRLAHAREGVQQSCLQRLTRTRSSRPAARRRPAVTHPAFGGMRFVAAVGRPVAMTWVARAARHPKASRNA